MEIDPTATALSKPALMTQKKTTLTFPVNREGMSPPLTGGQTGVIAGWKALHTG